MEKVSLGFGSLQEKINQFRRHISAVPVGASYPLTYQWSLEMFSTTPFSCWTSLMKKEHGPCGSAIDLAANRWHKLYPCCAFQSLAFSLCFLCTTSSSGTAPSRPRHRVFFLDHFPWFLWNRPTCRMVLKLRFSSTGWLLSQAACIETWLYSSKILACFLKFSV